MYIQPTFVVLTTGDDNASGVDAANAIATSAELARRLESGTFNQNVTVTYGPGSFGDLELELETTFIVTILGNVTDDIPQALAVVTPENATTKTRGAIEVPAGTFLQDQRVKVTSGAAIGALAYITKVLGPNDFNVDSFRKYNADASGLISSALTLISPAIGDTIVAETLNTEMQRVKLEMRGGGRLVTTDCRIRTSVSRNASHHCENDFTDAISGVFFKGCDFSSPSGFFSFIEGNMAFAICKFSGGVPIFEGCYMAFYGCYAARSSLTFGFNSFATFESSFCAAGVGANVLTNQGAHVQFNNPDCTFWDGVGGTALEVRFGSFATCRGNAQIWGNGAYANTLTIQSGCWLTYFAAKPPVITGGTKDFIVGGQSGFYSSLPFSNPANNSGIGLATI